MTDKSKETNNYGQTETSETIIFDYEKRGKTETSEKIVNKPDKEKK